MYIITYKGKPATLEKIYEAERDAVPFHTGTTERESYLAAPSAAKAKALFIYYIGFTWPERAKGIEVARVPNESLVIQGLKPARCNTCGKRNELCECGWPENGFPIPDYAAPGEMESSP